MYDAPLALLPALGWLLAGLVLVLGAVRAVRSESRFVGSAGSARRVGDVALDVSTALAVTGLLAVLVAVVVSGPA